MNKYLAVNFSVVATRGITAQVWKILDWNAFVFYFLAYLKSFTLAL